MMEPRELINYDILMIRLASEKLGVSKGKKLDTNNLFVPFTEDGLIRKVKQYNTGLSGSDVRRIFRGSEIIGSYNRKHYCLKASFLIKFLKAGNKNCKYVFVEDEQSRAIDNQ